MFSLFPFKHSAPSLSLQRYLKHVKWNYKHFSNENLEGKLVCAMYKYLSGKSTDINFILELSEEIRKKEGKKMQGSLSSITANLHELSQKIQKKEIDSNNTKTLYAIINKTQQISTHKSFLN